MNCRYFFFFFAPSASTAAGLSPPPRLTVIGRVELSTGASHPPAALRRGAGLTPGPLARLHLPPSVGEVAYSQSAFGSTDTVASLSKTPVVEGRTSTTTVTVADASSGIVPRLHSTGFA